jgi:hypothetical protein
MSRRTLYSQFEWLSVRANHRFHLHKSRQLFIGMHNETLSVVAMRVCNPDCSPVGINR